MNLYASVSSETPGAAIFAARQVRPQLGDARLMRELAYVAGRWQPALSGATLEVADPATGDVIGRVPDMGALDARAAIEAAHARVRPVEIAAPAGARDDPAPLARPDRRQQGRPRRHHDARAGQAAGGIARRDRLCGELRRVVRRGGQASRRRDADEPSARPADDCAARAGRRRRLRHAVELSLAP